MNGLTDFHQYNMWTIAYHPYLDFFAFKTLWFKFFLHRQHVFSTIGTWFDIVRICTCFIFSWSAIDFFCDIFKYVYVIVSSPYFSALGGWIFCGVSSISRTSLLYMISVVASRVFIKQSKIFVWLLVGSCFSVFVLLELHLIFFVKVVFSRLVCFYVLAYPNFVGIICFLIYTYLHVSNVLF